MRAPTPLARTAAGAHRAEGLAPEVANAPGVQLQAFRWTPGTAFGTGPQTLRTTMIDHFGSLGSFVTINFGTITTP